MTSCRATSIKVANRLHASRAPTFVLDKSKEDISINTNLAMPTAWLTQLGPFTVAAFSDADFYKDIISARVLTLIPRLVSIVLASSLWT